ncbi:MAG: D-aminoacyl-tRNA deacylase [Alphaproteobacteria bacterium]
MKVLVQRVKQASVAVAEETVSSVGKGFLVFVGVEKEDGEKEAEFLAKKISNLRIFEDADGKMNLSIKDIKGECLIVSQFTLAGDTSRGNRPGFETAARPEKAKPLYEFFSECVRSEGIPVQNGIFQADMQVSLINDGPVTFLLEK